METFTITKELAELIALYIFEGDYECVSGKNADKYFSYRGWIINRYSEYTPYLVRIESKSGRIIICSKDGQLNPETEWDGHLLREVFDCIVDLFSDCPITLIPIIEPDYTIHIVKI